MGKVMHLTYESSLVNLCERNSSFDTGILRVAYANENRNGSYIAKETFEKCIKTIFNCPIVCHYIRETDSIGGHDVEFVAEDDGSITIVNATVPLGVVPESAKYYWETVTEDNGQVHDYLCVEVLVWKRQEAYRKVKEDGIVSHSMEITVNRGHVADGLYIIEDFEFTALCLLGDGIEPCFEQAALEMFSLDHFKKQMTNMMSDLREEYATVSTQKRVDIDLKKNLTEGGEKQLGEKMELLEKFGLTADQVEFDLESMTLEQLEMELSKRANNADGDDDEPDNKKGNDDGADAVAESEAEAVAEVDADAAAEADGEAEDEAGSGEEEFSQDGVASNGSQFTLSGEQFREELVTALGTEKTTSIWGDEISRYMYCDYDSDSCEVYCYDMEDWKLYGFTYSMNGDHIIIDFKCKKRKKFSIVDFDEGDAEFSYKNMFDAIIKASADAKAAELTTQFDAIRSKLEEKYNVASNKITELNTELSKLRQYQQDKLKDERTAEEDAVFSAFTDLDGITAFEELRANCAEMSIEDIEEKCFAIRGRNTQTFSTHKQTKAPRLPIERHSKVDEPYSGLFVEFPPTR